MVKVISLLFCFLSLLVNGQGFGSFSHDQPFLAKDAASEETGLPTTKMAFRWVASDLSSSPVATWTDQIQAVQATQSGALRPGWATNGVYFDGSDDALVIATNAVVLSLNDDVGGQVDAILFVGNSTAEGGAHMVLGTDGTTDQHFLQAPGPRFYAGNGSYVTLAYPLGTPIDLLFWTHAAYTNGVLSVTNVNINVASTHSLIRMGKSGGDLYPFSGTINELVVWTNIGDAGFSASQIAQIHRYVTNTYSFVSP